MFGNLTENCAKYIRGNLTEWIAGRWNKDKYIHFFNLFASINQNNVSTIRKLCRRFFWINLLPPKTLWSPLRGLESICWEIIEGLENLNILFTLTLKTKLFIFFIFTFRLIFHLLSGLVLILILFFSRCCRSDVYVFPNVSFRLPWKRQKTKVSLMLPGGSKGSTRKKGLTHSSKLRHSIKSI